RPADRRYPQPTRPVCPARCPALLYNSVTGRARADARPGLHGTVVIGSRVNRTDTLRQPPPRHTEARMRDETACRTWRQARGKRSASGWARDFTRVSLRTAPGDGGARAREGMGPVGITHQAGNLSELRAYRSHGSVPIKNTFQNATLRAPDHTRVSGFTTPSFGTTMTPSRM